MNESNKEMGQQPMHRLAGKTAIVTGATRGIGKEIALTFALEGANVVVGDLNEVEISSPEVPAGKITVVKTDVTKKADVKRLVEFSITRFGKLDILVNNAGIPGRGDLLTMTEEHWQVVLDVCLNGVFLCSQAAAENMVSNKYGKIINIASVGGLIAFPGASVNYCTAKAGVIHFTKASARELGPHNINVNAIAPGLIITDLIYAGRTPEEAESYIESNSKGAVMRRAGKPKDIANVALFLALDDSSFITGHVIPVDGGQVGFVP